MQHLVDIGRGERGHIGETRHEPLEVGNDRADPGLLQHDFRNPDAVRRRVRLPGQILPAMNLEPVDHGIGETVRCSRA